MIRIAHSIVRWTYQERDGGGHAACMAGEKFIMDLAGKPMGKRPFVRTRRKWEDKIKMDLQELGWVKDWKDLAQDRDS